MAKCIDLVGQRFGKLVVVERTEDYVSPKGYHSVSWLCQCDCGCIKKVTGNSLKRHETRSCGCLCKERKPKNYKSIGSVIKNNSETNSQTGNENVETNNQINNKKNMIAENIMNNMDNRFDNHVDNSISFTDAYSKFESWVNNQEDKTLKTKSLMLWSALKFASDMNVIDEDTVKKTYGEFMFKQMEM